MWQGLKEFKDVCLFRMNISAGSVFLSLSLCLPPPFGANIHRVSHNMYKWMSARAPEFNVTLGRSGARVERQRVACGRVESLSGQHPWSHSTNWPISQMPVSVSKRLPAPGLLNTEVEHTRTLEKRSWMFKFRNYCLFTNSMTLNKILKLL